MSWENLLFAYAKTKAQISCVVIAQLISAFVFATQIVQSLYFLNTNFKSLAIFCVCTARLALDLAGIPEDRFSCEAAHISEVCVKQQPLGLIYVFKILFVHVIIFTCTPQPRYNTVVGVQNINRVS